CRGPLLSAPSLGRTRMVDPTSKGQKNRVEEMFNRLTQAGRAEEIARELDRFDPNRLEGAELESWYHLWGIVAFQKGDHARAFHRFQEGRSACPDSGPIAFSLGQEHEHRGEVEQMLALFDAYRFPKIPAKHALAQARYAYLWS